MKFTINISQKAIELVDKMDFRELLNQVVCPGYPYDLEDNKLDNFGSVFFHHNDKESMRQLVSEYKSKCSIPPLVVSDFEAGTGGMIHDNTVFPSFMALSETNDEVLTYEVGKITALEGKDLGFNWTFSPVIDVIKETRNPIVSTRGAGMDVDRVIKFAGAYTKGLQDNGMIATIKHFPGDGFSAEDQHLTTTVNPLSMEEWYKISGKAYKELIELGAMSIMPGHISLPAYDDANEFGVYPPATLSKKLLQGLLKDELGFDGLIVSDAINMGGAVGYMNYYKACATSLEAGCDVLLFPRINEDFYKEMAKEVELGTVSYETLKKRAVRIVSLKEQLGLFEINENKVHIDKEQHNEILKTVIDKSVKVIRDRYELLPFSAKKNSKILHIGIMNSIEEHCDLMKEMLENLQKYSSNVEQLLDPGPGVLFDKVYKENYDVIVCSIGNQINYGLNEGSLSGKVARNMMGGWSKLGSPVIFVGHYHPYIHYEFDAQVDCLINTFGSVDGTMDVLFKKIFK